MNIANRPTLSILVLGTALFSLCCSTGNLPEAPPPVEKEMLHLEIVSGNGQQGTGGRALDGRLTVRVADSSENPVQGVNLAFRVVEGGGTIQDGAVIQTDGNGGASVTWLIGPGYNGVEVTVNSDAFRAAPAYFWAEGEAGSGVHLTRTIASFRQKQGVLYEMTVYGDYSRGELYSVASSVAQGETASDDRAGYHCSLFSVFGLPGQYMLGRSFDNPSGWKCLTLLTRVDANDGYASIAPMRLRDIGFAPGSNFDSLTFEFKRRLLAAVRFPPDGVNECGLAMGLANVTPQPYTPDPAKQTIHFCMWVRRVLDSCRTVDEAVALTGQYNILSSGSSMDVHAMVADASGQSLILEPAQGGMKVIRGQGPFQVMTNSPVYQVSLSAQLEQCQRFRLIYETLAAADGALAAPGCWNILRQVGNVWTEWSAVYGISGRSATLAIDFNFDPLHDFYVQ